MRFARPEEWSQANQLHNRSYGVHRSMREWLWEFRGPRGADPLMVVALEGGRVLGTQAAIPLQMVDCGDLLLTAKSEETLIAPELRGLGIFGRMYEVLLTRCREVGVSVIWGFTPATKAFENLGFETPWKTQQLFFPLVSVAAREAAGREWNKFGTSAIDIAGAGLAASSKIRWRMSRLSAGLRQKPAEPHIAFSYSSSFPADCASFSLRFSQRWHLATLHRDTEFMNWRVERNPYVRARLAIARIGEQTVGWALYSVDSGSNGFIVDLVAASPEGFAHTGLERRVVDGLLRRALTALRSAGAKSVRMWNNSDHGYERLVRQRAVRLGFIHLRRGESSVFLPLARPEEFQRVVAGFHSRLSTEGVAG